MINLERLVKARVQIGHIKSRWSPQMKPYIWGFKHGVHLIDVSKTARCLEKAALFLEDIASQNKQILWVGTKKVAQAVVREVAGKVSMPFVDHRWVGGTLSNHTQVKKSVLKLLHYETTLSKSRDQLSYTKKELNVMQKAAERNRKVIGGIVNIRWPIGAIVLVDIGRTEAALKEAVSIGVPVVALVDTNCDPSMVDYVIPANDDAESSVRIILESLGEAVERGLARKVIRAAEDAAALELVPLIALPDTQLDDGADKAIVGGKRRGDATKRVHGGNPREGAAPEKSHSRDSKPRFTDRTKQRS